MSGFFYAFCAAFFAAVSDVLAKQALRRHSAVVAAWAGFGFSSIFLLPLLFFIPIPHLGLAFWGDMVLLLPLEIIAILLYMKALRISPLSMTVPFLSFTPAFTIFTSFFILGELPDGMGILGVCLIAAGAFLLNIHLLKEGLLAPFRRIVSEKGSMLVIAVAFIYSITSVLGKAAIRNSSPEFMGIFYVPLISVCMLPLAIRKGMRISDLRSGGVLFLMLGLSQALGSLCHFKGISMILVSYMISVKRLSLLLSVLFGGIFFHEEHIRERLLGCFVMVLGVVLIVL